MSIVFGKKLLLPAGGGEEQREPTKGEKQKDPVVPPGPCRGGGDVDASHREYIQALTTLYNNYKCVVPEWDCTKELNIV